MAWFNAGLSSNSGGASSFNELDDVTINTQTLSNGQVPVYNSTTHKWENGEQSGGVSSFNELDDVSINAQTLLNGQVPIYNSTTHKWENGEQCSGHTIIDDGGTSLTQRDNLQFKGAYSEDNSTNQKTVVNVVRSMTKAEFDELTEAEKTGLINITDITGGNDDRFQPVIYSTEEREIGVYTDGKPLYQKTIILPSAITIPAETWTTVATVTDLDIDSLTYCFGNASLMTQIVSVNAMVKTEGNNKVLQVFFAFVWSIRTVTLQYTKTTDAAGSGQWTPQGIPAHHYSEDEQVVGTWIDGNTLYEKTISFTTTNNSNYIQQPVGLLKAEIDKVWVVDGFTYKNNVYSSVMPYAYTNNTVADDQFEGLIDKSSTNVTFDYRVGKDLYEAPAYVTIRYTKSV